MFKSILVAVDGSTQSELALEQAVDLARSEGSRLTLIGVAGFSLSWPSVQQRVVSDAELVQAMRAVVDDAAETLPEDIPVRTIVRLGKPGDEIFTEASRGEYDLIVMGSRGRGAATSALLGSVSHTVLNHGPAAVLIVQAQEASAKAAGRPSQRD
jgi:nucleotide-binding universal stress UspA family protein